MSRGNRSEHRGRGFIPARVTLDAATGSAFRALAAALELLSPAANGAEVGDGVTLARLLAASYARRPVETLARLGPLIVAAQQQD
jgi:hypothetical protein